MSNSNQPILARYHGVDAAEFPMLWRAIVIVDNVQRSNVDVGRRLRPLGAGSLFVNVFR